MKGRFPETRKKEEKKVGSLFFVINFARRSFRQLAGLSKAFGAGQRMRRLKTLKNDSLFTSSSSHGHEVPPPLHMAFLPPRRVNLDLT